MQGWGIQSLRIHYYGNQDGQSATQDSHQPTVCSLALLEFPEPLQIAYAWVSIEECWHQQKEKLCYYFRKPDHPNASCPHKKSSPPESVRKVSTTNFVSPPLTSNEVSINESFKCVTALVDTGAAVNLIHQDLVQELSIPSVKWIPSIHVTTVHNAPISSGITQQTAPVTLKIGLFHVEHLYLYVKLSKTSCHLGASPASYSRFVSFLEPRWVHTMFRFLSGTLSLCHCWPTMFNHQHRTPWCVSWNVAPCWLWWVCWSAQ